ncbi:ABC transporter B family member 2 [Spatholobus suberectus]|nr:ABC transporter B family member 2 [Spatholobus suberectus]
MSDRGPFAGVLAVETKERKKEETTQQKRKVPLLKLFSFADFYDCVLMAVGSVGACVHGASVPVFFIFFGKMINVIGFAYLFPKEASHEVAKYALDFVYLSIAILFSSWTEVACWMHTGERQAAKMRMAYLRSMLNQDISLFDTEASTGEVISSITSDIIVVQDALSEKVGNFMHYISRFIAGFTIGFVRVWQISLVTLAIVPLIALAGGLYAYVTIGLIGKVRKAYVRAGEISEESPRKVYRRLDRVMVGRTTVIVAHRLSTVRNADMIAVIEGGKVVEIGNHEELISNPNKCMHLLSNPRNSLFSRPVSVDPYLGGSSRYLEGESSSRATSFRGSFRSDKESTSRAFGDGAENVGSSRHVSARRLYSMIGPDWLYGVFGTLGAFIAGAQMPLFALGISHALVAYYMDWDTTRHEVKKIAFLFCGAAVLTITAHAIEHLSFGIMGERLTLRAREKCFPNVGLVVASFIIAFMLNWRITLVVLATYPLIISGHISEKLFMQGFGGNLSKAYLKANMLAGEAVSNIRTGGCILC